MPLSRYVLKQFGGYCAKLAQELKDESFTPEDRMYVENHLLIVQLALTMSKYSHARARASTDE